MCDHTVSTPPQQFPPAREVDAEAMPMWAFWLYLAVLTGLVVGCVWSVLS